MSAERLSMECFLRELMLICFPALIQLPGGETMSNLFLKKNLA